MSNKKISRRDFLKSAALIGGGAALAACQAQATEEPAEEMMEEETVAEAPPAKEPVEIGFMHFSAPTWEDGIKSFIQTFEDENPDIKVNWIPFPWGQYWEAVTTGLASGYVPDVLLLVHFNIDEYIMNEALQPLDLFMEASDWDQSQFYPVSNNHMTIQGKRYGVGWSTEGSCIFYNKNIFEEAGVEPPPADGNWTWDDLVELAKKVTKRQDDGTPEYLGLTLNNHVPHEDGMGDIIFSNGGRTINDFEGYDKCLLGEAEARQALKFFYDVALVEKVAPSTADMEILGGDGYITGKYAMYWAQSGRFSNFLDAPFETDIVPAPVSSNTGYRLSGSSSNFYTMTKDARYPEEAWRFMMWLGTGDRDDSPQAIWARDIQVNVPHIAANEKYWLQNNPERNRQAALDSMKHHFRYPHCPPVAQVTDIVRSELEPILSGADFDSTLDNCVELINQALAENPTPTGWAEAWEENPDYLEG